ncbi:MAG TPA: VRR-NUC domain-containing protein [Massilibacterium sp.]|nr:VRR-NUC domain-containing protein [Massilibacterium sp.]
MKKTQEINIQHSILLWFNQTFPPNEAMIFPVPNEGTYNNKQLTVLKGVSDLVVVFPERVYFIEVKNGTNKQTKYQKVFESRCNALGYDYAVVYSLEEFKKVIGRQP